VQTTKAFLKDLKQENMTYALYEMIYPVILPSAVYLYCIFGEAQHHSSRIIEEFFDVAGLEARETENFGPMGYPAFHVVELWQIKVKDKYPWPESVI